ncbi:alanine racemase [Pelotomaculum terephthalicicum JT]|uniref:alanine racemase n=1 Tax=Pelotomaculum TaxID=191373 RepID=UPI0009D1BD88|nr:MULTISPECIES: alanine racemase [Pelotomaculum]MCG9967633.1 alanine racemase [Pelotomaculum terephthalicicum JT]OPX84069.1 MAG: Alanine racemase [Pelotomaculum sp. PtaB.Bin117]OPY60849.1 MAG: Alanine racemase [Pelotomaculum sp. PtaU1.Bin065]
MSAYPVWAEIDLDAIANNVREIRRVTKSTAKVLAVVKANGYGHGAVEVSRVALANGASWLGVARISEGVALRKAGLEAPVLVLSYIPPEQAGEVVRHRLSQAVYTREMALVLAEAAARRGTRAKVHIKVDTGMGRIGLMPGPDIVEEILRMAKIPNLEIEGIFTHFADADAADKHYTNMQLERFLGITEELRRGGLDIPLKHAANSPALMEMPEAHLDMVRAGIIVYGLSPSDRFKQSSLKLIPAMSLKAKVAYVKKVPAGFKVSYGCTFTTVQPTVIATLPLGYADGYPRSLSSKGEVLLNGRRSPVIGRVCMDQIMVDAGSASDIKMGDEAVIIGRQGDEEITADETAMKLGTINYEVVCMISLRVPRIYVK